MSDPGVIVMVVWAVTLIAIVGICAFIWLASQKR